MEELEKYILKSPKDLEIVKTDTTTIANTHIEFYKTVQKRHPKIIFDNFFTRSLTNLIPDFYSTGKPYDTIVRKTDRRTKRIKDFVANSTRLKKNPKEYAAVYEKSLNNKEHIRKVDRKVYWDKILSIHQKYATKDLFNEIKKFVNEIHDSLGLSWTDSIYVWNMNEEEIIENTKTRIDNVENQK